MTQVVAYGAVCTWWDDKSKVATKPSGLPCCPICGGVLYETERDVWWRGAQKHEAEGHPGYGQFLAWLQGKCFANSDQAELAYQEYQKTIHPLLPIALGKADWVWDSDLETHIPCCSQPKEFSTMPRCGNGPLTTPEQIASGDCGEHE